MSKFRLSEAPISELDLFGGKYRALYTRVWERGKGGRINIEKVNVKNVIESCGPSGLFDLALNTSD
jgi:hypothetical protein